MTTRVFKEPKHKRRVQGESTSSLPLAISISNNTKDGKDDALIRLENEGNGRPGTSEVPLILPSVDRIKNNNSRPSSPQNHNIKNEKSRPFSADGSRRTSTSRLTLPRGKGTGKFHLMSNLSKSASLPTGIGDSSASTTAVGTNDSNDLVAPTVTIDTMNSSGDKEETINKVDIIDIKTDSDTSSNLIQNLSSSQLLINAETFSMPVIADISPDDLLGSSNGNRDVNGNTILLTDEDIDKALTNTKRKTISRTSSAFDTLTSAESHKREVFLDTSSPTKSKSPFVLWAATSGVDLSEDLSKPTLFAGRTLSLLGSESHMTWRKSANTQLVKREIKNRQFPSEYVPPEVSTLLGLQDEDFDYEKAEPLEDVLQRAYAPNRSIRVCKSDVVTVGPVFNSEVKGKNDRAYVTYIRKDKSWKRRMNKQKNPLDLTDEGHVVGATDEVEEAEVRTDADVQNSPSKMSGEKEKLVDNLSKKEEDILSALAASPRRASPVTVLEDLRSKGQVSNDDDDNDYAEVLDDIHRATNNPFQSTARKLTLDESLYVGDVAKIQFNNRFHELTAILENTTSESAETLSGNLSPRSLFLYRYITTTPPPRPPPLALVVRDEEDFAKERLDCENMMLKDKYVSLLSEVLPMLPRITSVNMRSNLLHDAGLVPLIRGVSQQPRIVSLDISQNKIDSEASASLFEYVSSKTCHLTALIMSSADMDDSELAEFIPALEVNRSIVSLDLSANSLGYSSAEIRTFNPLISPAGLLSLPLPASASGGRCCGEHISTVLAYNSVLKQLDLSNNKLGPLSCSHLGQSLGVASLVSLNLARNGIKDLGCEALVGHLFGNKTLRHLDLSDNGITMKGALCISVILRANPYLTGIKLCNNPLGLAGGEVILSSLNFHSGIRLIELRDCTFVDDTKMELAPGFQYNRNCPTGTYNLDMSRMLDRAVALDLLYLATIKRGCTIKQLEYTSTARNRAPTKSTIRLTRPPNPNPEHVMGDAYGPTRSEYPRGVHPLTEMHGDDWHAQLNKLRLVNEKTGKIWTVPESGELFVDFEYVPRLPTPIEALNKDGLSRLIFFLDNLRRDLDPFLKVCQSVLILEVEQLMQILSHCKKSMGATQLQSIFLHLLPCVRSSCRLEKVIRKHFADFPSSGMFVQFSLRNLLNVLTNSLSGHYRLDLSVPIDRITAIRLAEVSADENILLSKVKPSWATDETHGFTSQHGLRSNFRNVVYKNKEMQELDAMFFSGGLVNKASGILEFDFVSISRPDEGVPAISDYDLNSILLSRRVISRVDGLQIPLQDLSPFVLSLPSASILPSHFTSSDHIGTSLVDRFALCPAALAHDQSLHHSTHAHPPTHLFQSSNHRVGGVWIFPHTFPTVDDLKYFIFTKVGGDVLKTLTADMLSDLFRELEEEEVVYYIHDTIERHVCHVTVRVGSPNIDAISLLRPTFQSAKPVVSPQYSYEAESDVVDDDDDDDSSDAVTLSSHPSIGKASYSKAHTESDVGRGGEETPKLRHGHKKKTSSRHGKRPVKSAAVESNASPMNRRRNLFGTEGHILECLCVYTNAPVSFFETASSGLKRGKSVRRDSDFEDVNGSSVRVLESDKTKRKKDRVTSDAKANASGNANSSDTEESPKNVPMDDEYRVMGLVPTVATSTGGTAGNPNKHKINVKQLPFYRQRDFTVEKIRRVEEISDHLIDHDGANVRGKDGKRVNEEDSNTSDEDNEVSDEGGYGKNKRKKGKVRVITSYEPTHRIFQISKDVLVAGSEIVIKLRSNLWNDQVAIDKHVKKVLVSLLKDTESVKIDKTSQGGDDAKHANDHPTKPAASFDFSNICTARIETTFSGTYDAETDLFPSHMHKVSAIKTNVLMHALDVKVLDLAYGEHALYSFIKTSTEGHSSSKVVLPNEEGESDSYSHHKDTSYPLTNTNKSSGSGKGDVIESDTQNVNVNSFIHLYSRYRTHCVWRWRSITTADRDAALPLNSGPQTERLHVAASELRFASSRMWITCRQAAAIARLFPLNAGDDEGGGTHMQGGHHKHKHHKLRSDSYSHSSHTNKKPGNNKRLGDELYSRVSIIVTLFSRLVDLKNFHLLSHTLPPPYREALYSRLGYLNCLSSDNIAGEYKLNLSVYDNRIVMMALLELWSAGIGLNLTPGNHSYFASDHNRNNDTHKIKQSAEGKADNKDKDKDKDKDHKGNEEEGDGGGEGEGGWEVLAWADDKDGVPKEGLVHVHATFSDIIDALVHKPGRRDGGKDGGMLEGVATMTNSDKESLLFLFKNTCSDVDNKHFLQSAPRIGGL